MSTDLRTANADLSATTPTASSLLSIEMLPSSKIGTPLIGRNPLKKLPSKSALQPTGTGYVVEAVTAVLAMSNTANGC